MPTGGLNLAAVTFPAPPPAGTQLVYRDGQVYTFAGTRPHTTRDGREITLLLWDTVCPESGEPFQTTSTLALVGLVRRAPGHRKPGRRVVPLRPAGEDPAA